MARRDFRPTGPRHPFTLSPLRSYPFPAKFAGLQMAGFATAMFEPAKIAGLFDRGQQAHKRN
jgi:hypothetical protein